MNSIDWRNATPDQLQAYKFACSKIAVATVTPLNLNTVYAGSELLTYDAAHIYFALKLRLTCGTITAAIAWCTLYDEANAAMGIESNPAPTYTGAAVNYVNNTVILENVWFSRIVAATYSYIYFNGYRLHT